MSNDILLPKSSQSINQLESNNTSEPIQKGKFQGRVVTIVSHDVLESHKSKSKRDLGELIYSSIGKQYHSILSTSNKAESVQALMNRSVEVLNKPK